MSAPLPSALQAWFQQLSEEGLRGQTAARCALISHPPPECVRALRTGRSKATPQARPRGKGKLDPHGSFVN